MAQLEAPAASSGTALWRRLAILLLLAAALFLPLWHIHIIDRNYPLPGSCNDLIGRWVGTRAALHGKDPYSPQVFAEIQAAYYGHPISAADRVPDQAFNYPAHLVVLLAPFAPLSWLAFRLTFLFTVVPLLLLSFWLGIEFLGLRIPRGKTALIVLLAFSSWPVLFGLRMLQPALPVCALMLLACYLVTRHQGAAAGFLLALATVKPQLVVPLLLWLFLWTALRRQWSLLVSFTITLALLLIAAEIMVPGWFPEWLAAIRIYHALYPTLPLQLLLGHWPGMAATLLITVWGGWRLWQLRRCSLRSPAYGHAISLVLAITVCANSIGNPSVPPMLQAQILLLPAAALLLWTKRPAGNGYPVLVYRLGQILLAWLFAAVPLAVAGESLFRPAGFWYGLPFLNALLPIPLTLFLINIARPEGDAGEHRTAPVGDQRLYRLRQHNHPSA
ncbi:MAG TPA: glycosyltransferase family 87 protein [Acidobacteriaceae bacterium]|nr:glycosyltransferase family 87 protein [Acidobacteriaceae bacterium]